MKILFAKQTLRTYQRAHNILTSLDPAANPYACISPGSAQPRGTIVVFPGSFNPPTSAHLAMLQQARTFARHQGGCWQVYAALSKYSVDKEAVERMTLLDRVMLLERVLTGQGAHAGIMLLNRGLYVEQGLGIRVAFPRVRRLFFLVGFDKIVQILDPRYYTERDAPLRELFSRAQLLVAPRGANGERELAELLARPENRPFASSIRLLPLAERYREMSSSQIRQNAQSSEIPALARDFIWRTHPYNTPSYPATASPQIDLYAERTRALQELLR
ncbi:MAG: hypothetical protein ABI234_10665 [Ktedonobacteraceae bacterium]